MENFESRQYIKQNKRKLIEKFADIELFPASKEPVTIFMAGSPGAGKTEFSRNLDKEILKLLDIKARSVIIDADEIKTIFPNYDPRNTDIVKSGAMKGVDILYDYALHHRQNIILDGTFSSKKSLEDLKRSLDKNRKVVIFYIYQDPTIAWDFTKKRGLVEGRFIPKEYFIDSFFKAINNVNNAKKEYNDKVSLHFVEQNISNKMKMVRLHVKSVDSYIKKIYDKRTLADQLEE